MSTGSYIDKPNRPLRLYALLFLTVLYVPILFIPLFSFNNSLYVKFPLEDFTVQWYMQLVHKDAVLHALWNSIRVGFSVAVLTTALGTLAAKALSRSRMPGRAPVLSFIMLPLVVPGIVFGVSLLVLLSQMGIRLSLYTVMLGHIIVCLPFAIATLLPRFEGFDKSMEEASGDLGENGWFTFWRVTFPIVYPGIVASLLLTFTISFDEFIMAFFLTGTEPTLPMYIWGQLRFPQEFPTVLALSSLVLLFSFLVVFLGLWIGRHGLVSEPGEK